MVEPKNSIDALLNKGITAVGLKFSSIYLHESQLQSAEEDSAGHHFCKNHKTFLQISRARKNMSVHMPKEKDAMT